MRAQLKAVLRPSHTKPDRYGRPTYRYIVMGVIATDTPLTDVDGDRVWEDNSADFVDMLETITLRAPRLVNGVLGDADATLIRLGEL